METGFITNLTKLKAGNKNYEGYQLSKAASVLIKKLQKHYMMGMYEFDSNGILIAGSMKSNKILLENQKIMEEGINRIKEVDYSNWLGNKKREFNDQVEQPTLDKFLGLEFKPKPNVESHPYIKINKEDIQYYLDYENWSKFKN